MSITSKHITKPSTTKVAKNRIVRFAYFGKYKGVIQLCWDCSSNSFWSI